MGFVLAPLVVTVAASVNPTPILQFPPSGVSFVWFRRVLTSDIFVPAFRASIRLAVVSTSVTMLIGLPAAYGATRLERARLKEIILGLLMSPLMVPQLVMGIGLLQFYSYLGVSMSFVTLLFGHVLVQLPYVIRTVLACLANVDPALEEAAQNLGASRLRAVVAVVLPLARPGIIAGGIFAFVVSFDNVLMTLFLATARNVTLPIQMLAYTEHNLDPSIAAVATLLLGNSCVLLILLRRIGGLRV
jgi:putative spermidine/putrescine transport system permease protein